MVRQLIRALGNIAMPEEDDNIFARCFDRMDSGADQDEIIAYLHEQDTPAVEAVLITMKLYGLRPKEARRLIANHPSWRGDV